jgi:hypothetical protein
VQDPGFHFEKMEGEAHVYDKILVVGRTNKMHFPSNASTSIVKSALTIGE